MKNNSFAMLEALLAEVGQIRGRKKFQKIVHILKVKGADFNESFDYHYFGPYSSELQLELDEMTSKGILKEEEGANGCYEYSLAYEGKDVAEKIPYSDLANYLNNQQPQVLELVSTFYYLLEHGVKDFDTAVQKAAALKPHLAHRIETAKEVYDFVEKI